MKRSLCRFGVALFAAALLAANGFAQQAQQAQQALTWQDIQAKFQAANPSLLAGQIGIDESRAQEISAYLRPNPNLAVLLDQIAPFDSGPEHGPFAYLLPSATVSYLHERRHKRELRLENAQDATKIAISNQDDLVRNLLFNLRQAFVQTLQEKAVLALAKENLDYYDHLLGVNRDRYQAGDIAHVDLDRLELQRVQYESDFQTAAVNLRTAKIQLLMLLNDRTPVEQFDVTGPFDFSAQILPLDQARQTALDTRPDLRSAMQSVEQAEAARRLAVADGSTDPTIAVDVGRNPPIDAYFGLSVSVPLRVFDRNQGEKLRTKLDIDKNQRQLDVARAKVFSDVDSAYATIMSSVALLQPYKDHYLEQASRVRDTISFSYEHGAASLLDLLNAQQDYRGVQLSYLNLIAAYLQAAGQLNLAVGREVIQ